MVDPVAAVQSAFPGHRVELEGAGQMSVAVRVDDELIVRVPRHEYGIGRLRFEVDLLRTIGHLVTVRIPEIVESELDLPPGQAFVAHRRIAGRLLDRSSVEALGQGEIDHIGRQVGRFLSELHAIDLALVPGVPLSTPAVLASQLAAEVDERLSARLSRQQLDGLLVDLAGLHAIPDLPVVLAHSDLGGNIVVDEAGNVGIIDFGSCSATHPAVDVASVSTLGGRFVHAVAAEYPLLGTLSVEADAVSRTFRLQDLLHGARQDDWAYVGAILDSTS